MRADFDLSVDTRAKIRYLETDVGLTVEWHKLSLDGDRRPAGQTFTFQATLKWNADIAFAYDMVPTSLAESDIAAVGISDAFVSGQHLYEYHTIGVDHAHIRNKTVVKFKARETCNTLRNCTQCLSTRLPTFTCQWCPSAGRCSSGMDRLRENWELNDCHLRNVTSADSCNAQPTPISGPSIIRSQHHEFYNVSFNVGESESWVNSPYFVNVTSSTVDLPLSFSFPYYGHQTHQLVFFPRHGVVAVDSTGLNFFTHGRYITPLLGRYAVDAANPNSRFAYLDDGARFVAEWREVLLVTNHTRWLFSFQVIIDASGSITFAYKEVTGKISDLPGGAGSHRIGISDTYVRDEAIPAPFDVPLSTYESYHSIDLSGETDFIDDSTAVVFAALPTCSEQADCAACHRLSDACMWCDSVGSCSRRGTDRLRQKWETGGCDLEERSCPEKIIGNEAMSSNSANGIVSDDVTDDHKYYASRVTRDLASFEEVWKDNRYMGHMAYV